MRHTQTHARTHAHTHAHTHTHTHNIHTSKVYIWIHFQELFYVCSYVHMGMHVQVSVLVGVCPCVRVCVCCVCVCARYCPCVLRVDVAFISSLLSLSRCHGDTTVEEERELTEGRGLCCCLWHGLLLTGGHVQVHQDREERQDILPHQGPLYCPVIFLYICN